MSEQWNKNQWGAQPGGYSGNPPGLSPGHNQSLSEPTYQGGGGYGVDQKSPYEGDRSKSKKIVKDPIFLVFFLLQVSHGPLITL